ncbi:MAG: sigma-54 dependent transcriptional regulator [Woeseiaceae bacterium]
MADSSGAQAKVWVMDSNLVRAHELSHRLRFLNYDPIVAGEGDAIDPNATEAGIALVLGDAEDGKIRALFHEVAVKQPSLPVLLVNTDRGSDQFDADLNNRPHWTLDAPIRRSQLTQLLRRAQRYDGTERRQRITGSSRPIREVRKLIEQVADFDTNVLITGESGTGKELVARTIHDLSDRADKPFVPINCGAIPAELLESELFGHEKGAFTGAVNSRTGRFELAEGGTLFLDEIGDMSLDMQVKLLRVLQEKCFERVGSNETRQTNVRIIAATHRNLTEASQQGDFREDLYYRLSVFPIEMPPLYKRASDLPQLLDELLIQHQGDNAGALRIGPEALQALTSYAWPGNIRELSNLVERLAILYPTGEISLEDLPAKYRDVASQCPAPSAENQRSEQTTATLTGASLKLHLQEIEIDLISRAMEEADGVVAGAARLLNMRRTTLVEKLSKYKLS